MDDQLIDTLAVCVKESIKAKIIFSLICAPISIFGFFSVCRLAKKSFDAGYKSLVIFYEILAFILFSLTLFNVKNIVYAAIAPNYVMLEQTKIEVMKLSDGSKS